MKNKFIFLSLNESFAWSVPDGNRVDTWEIKASNTLVLSKTWNDGIEMLGKTGYSRDTYEKERFFSCCCGIDLWACLKQEMILDDTIHWRRKL